VVLEAPPLGEPADRVVFFTPSQHPALSLVALVTPKGRTSYEIAQLPKHEYDGVLPPAMLPSVCWLYRLVEGQIRFAPEVA
jgi:hypothetical protein